MINAGLYHTFNFVSKYDDIDTQCIYYTPLATFILTGQFTTAEIREYGTDTVVQSGTEVSWVVDGVTLYARHFSFSLVQGKTYYVYVDYHYSDCVIKWGNCVTEILTKSDCSNTYFDWAGNLSYEIQLLLSNANILTPKIQSKTVTIVDSSSQIEKRISEVVTNRIQYLGPSGHSILLNALAKNTYVAINTIAGYKEIQNIKIDEAEQDNGRYTLFVINFEYVEPLNQGDGCCDIIDIDDIISPEYVPGGFECNLLTSEIINTTGTLSVTLTDEPIGTPTYKWYLNNVYLSAAPTLAITTAGNYRVDVSIATCRTSATYFKDNPCSIFSIDVTKTGNEINATPSNVPSGATVTYSIVLNGVQVGTALPYTAIATGTHYIYATAGDCLKSKGIYVLLEATDCDFTISITESGSVLTAVTNAVTPTYLWELETGTGRTTVGTASTLTLTGKGVYWLTITNAGCSKEKHKYKEPLATLGTCVLARTTTTALQPITVYGINLLNITAYSTSVLLTVNGVTHGYVSGVPTLANTYSVDSTGKLIFANAFTNALIIITLI